DPPASPDQSSRLVVAAPHEAAVRRDRVAAAAADQRAEHGVVVPLREAHPGEVAARADEDPALAVGKQRVLAQRVRIRDLGRASPRGAHRTRRSAPAIAAALASNPVERALRWVLAHKSGLCDLDWSSK